MTKTRWIVLGAAAGMAVVGFLLFRPDTLFTDVEVDETLEEAFATATTMPPEVDTTEAAPSSTTLPEEAGPTTTAGTASGIGEPVVVSGGGFVGIDHTASGTAAIYEQDGRYVLRFEDDTEIQNGPDLYVWLLPEEAYAGGTPESFVDLGTLKGTVGGQNYELPPDFDPGGAWTVLIWCLRFEVPFASAELA